MKSPTLKELECLIRWPDLTVGAQEERTLVHQLLILCRKYGFGRIPQLASSIEQIWRDPEKIKEFQNQKEKHLQFMSECREEITNPPVDKHSAGFCSVH